MNKVGIVSYGAGIPVCRLKVDDVIQVWKNTDLSLVKGQLGVLERAVLQPDEDVITLGVLAAQRALDKAPPCPLEALYLGTCTNPYDSRASAAIIRRKQAAMPAGCPLLQDAPQCLVSQGPEP